MKRKLNLKKFTVASVLISFIAIAGVTFTGCNNATTQGQLANILSKGSNREAYSYTVTRKNADDAVVSTGAYDVVVEGKNAGTAVEVGSGFTLPKVKKGILVTTALTIDDVTITTGCYFNLIDGSSFLVPQATYRLETKAGAETKKLTGSYSGGTLNYTYASDGKKTSSSINAKAPFYDNNQFQQMLRGVTTMSTSFSFAFNVPVVAKEIAVAQLTANCTKTENIKNIFTDTHETLDKEGATLNPYKEKGIECYVVDISRKAQVQSVSQTLYYASSNVEINGWSVRHILVRMVEPVTGGGTVTYDLNATPTLGA